jgi:D-alanyl-D-alanine carboxypeptidase
VTVLATRRGPALLLVGALLLAACSAPDEEQTGAAGSRPAATKAPETPSGAPTPARTSTPTPTVTQTPTVSESPTPTRKPAPRSSVAGVDPATLEQSETARGTKYLDANANVEPVPHRQWEKMVDAGMWRPECPVTRKELRRVEVNHYTFSGKVKRGVLVVNRDVAASVSRIFTRLFRARYPIRKMRPVEVYNGNSNASLRADNTAAYNCRRPTQINAPPKESPHANGRAIDINPRENPWMDLRCDCWSPVSRTHARKPGLGVIVSHGVVWDIFADEGWIWQDIDVPDYMHFDTGYPSESYKGPRSTEAGGQDNGAGSHP